MVSPKPERQGFTIYMALLQYNMYTFYAYPMINPKGIICLFCSRYSCVQSSNGSDNIAFVLQRPDKRWFVFGIFNGHEPYLEYYGNQDDLYKGDPIKYISLANARHVLPGLIGGKSGHLFTIVTSLREYCLIAATR